MDAAPDEEPPPGEPQQRESSRRLRLCVVSAVLTVIVVGCFLMLGFSLKRNEELVAVLDRYREHLNQMGSTAHHSVEASKDPPHAKRAIQRPDGGTRPDRPQVVYLEGPTPSADDMAPMEAPRVTRLSRLRFAQQVQESQDSADSDVPYRLSSTNGSFSNDSVQFSLDSDNLTDILFNVNASWSNGGVHDNATVAKEDVNVNGTLLHRPVLNGSTATPKEVTFRTSALGSAVLSVSNTPCENASHARDDPSVTKPSGTISASTREKYSHSSGFEVAVTNVTSGVWNQTTSVSFTSAVLGVENATVR